MARVTDYERPRRFRAQGAGPRACFGKAGCDNRAFHLGIRHHGKTSAVCRKKQGRHRVRDMTDYRYDDQRRRIAPAQPTRIATAADGSWTEIGEIRPGAEAIAWHRFKQVGGALGFAGVRDATRVVSRFDARGIPAELIFLNQQDEVLTRAVFEADERGNIVRASFYGGMQPVSKLSEIYQRLTNPSDKEMLRSLLEAGAVQSEVRFEYDAAGKLIGKASFIYRRNTEGEN